MGKKMLAGIIAVVAVVMLVFSMSMPWYTVGEEYRDEEDPSEDRVRTWRVYLSLLPQSSDSEREQDNTTTTLTITSWMATAGTAASMVSLLFIGMAATSDKKSYVKIGSIFLIVGLIFAILAPLFFMVSFPRAILNDQYDGDKDNLPEDQDTPAESFFGSETSERWGGREVKESWGGGIGWFMSIIGGIILIPSLILVLLGGKKSQPTMRGSPYTQPQQRYQQPQQEQQYQQPQQQQQYRPPEQEQQYQQPQQQGQNEDRW